MTSLNAVLQKFFNLPPAMRMLLAVAGFGSLASIVYFLTGGFLSSREGKKWILIVGGLGVLVFLLVWGARRSIFGRKSSRLSGALESQGPTRGDVAAQEQIYRQKFRTKLTELKANGLSVYRLPWFVLMGEPGCGKTASLIHSGLDFPLGKDEVPGFGGTRNYNWWFANEAVILDTAGRISFHEEGTTDKVEWEYFLKLLREHRQRCPINGVIVALPADKLLRDSSEERAQKAAILRERLRQVHQTLGVRFPTFVLVTKMDLVGGFSEFFEEIRVDLQQRNQMFGWSRPGEFQAPYDPAGFPDAFDAVYYRLRDWSMRYLQRKATEEELGMIVTFPESFRQLRQPLDDHVSTIFQKSPLLEPPFFRGFYFTSAVQEGAPIFDVFTRRRAGVMIPERPLKAVDSKAFFIHDFYQRKVFAEHGLVFRSAQHVTLNQRMRRMVWAGSAALIVLMLALFVFGAVGIRGLVRNPQNDCKAAAEWINPAHGPAASLADLDKNLKLATRLQAHYEAYGSWWTSLRAKAMFIGASLAEPRDAIRQVHARFVLNTVLRPILAETERLLTQGELRTDAERARYVAALAAYTRWWGELAGEAAEKGLDTPGAVEERGEQFKRLVEFVGRNSSDAKGPFPVTQVKAALEAPWAQRRSFAREILPEYAKLERGRAPETIVAGSQTLRGYWERLTVFTDDHPDADCRYWARLASAVANLRAAYGELLNLQPEFQKAAQPGVAGEAQTAYENAARSCQRIVSDLDELGQVSYRGEGVLVKAYGAFVKYLSDQAAPADKERILRPAQLRERLSGQWKSEFGQLRAALAVGAPQTDRAPQKDVYTAVDQSLAQLDAAMDAGMAELRKKVGDPREGPDVPDFLAEQGLLKIEEVSAGGYKGPPRVTLGLEPFGPANLLVQYLKEIGELAGGVSALESRLADLREWPALLRELSEQKLARGALARWQDAVRKKAAEPQPRGAGRQEDIIVQNAGLALFWQPAPLYTLAEAVVAAHRARSAEALLGRIASKCEESVRDGRPGLAGLVKDFDEPLPKELPFERPVVERAPAKTEPEPKEPPAEEGVRRRPRRAAEPPAGEEPSGVRDREERNLLARYHTREFLAQTLRLYYDVQQALTAYGTAATAAGGALDGSAKFYVRRYFTDWDDVYRDGRKLLDGTTLKLLEQCRAGELDWAKFHESLTRSDNRMADALAVRLEALAHEVALYHYEFEEKNARDDALYKLVEASIRQLGDTSPSLPDRLVYLTQMAERIEAKRPEKTLATRLVKAWDDYIKDVGELGPQARRPDGRLPARDTLAKELEQVAANRASDFALTAPLLDLAAYAEQLLRHDLDARLAGVLEPGRNRYPCVRDATDRDPNFAGLVPLAERSLPPEEFYTLLQQLYRFQQDYAKLFAALHTAAGDPYVVALADGAKWLSFLYGDKLGRVLEAQPAPLRVKLAVAKRKGTTSAASVYNKLMIRLPLLSDTGEPVRQISVDVRSAFGEGGLPQSAAEALAAVKEFKYRWSLFQNVERGGEHPGVVLEDRNPTAKAGFQERVAIDWPLQASPWLLLLLVGADPASRPDDRQCVIPVLLKLGNETVGFDIAIEFERPLPGPLRPVESPGPPPKMAAAEKYLSVGTPGRTKP